MSHEHPEVDLDAMFSAPFWDDRYATGETTWSGNPNPRLVERVAGLTPGAAFDAGVGDGADAIWLAGRGWQVTGADVSGVAIEKAAVRAEAAGVADRITWEQVDLRTFAPAEASYDLVSAQFLHLPGIDDVHRRLAAAVRPGGTLLLVMHHPSHLEGHSGGWMTPELFHTPEQVAAVFDDGWDVHTEAPTREGVRDGEQMTIQDTIVVARRR